MHARYSIPAALLFAIASSVSAFAQTTSAPGTVPWQRFSASVIGGAVSRPPTAPIIGVEVADHFSPHVEAYANLSYIDNLMRQTLRDDLDATATRLAALTGDPWSLTGRDRGIAVVGGAKYMFGRGFIRPYVGGGAGVINLKRSVFESRIGDVTQAVFNDFRLGDAELADTLTSVTKPMVEFALGVGIGDGRTRFDIGYRYRSAYQLATKLDFSQVSAGIGVRW